MKKKKKNLYVFLFHSLLFPSLWGCLVNGFKQPFLVFKQYFTHFNALFHPHVFPQIFLNNNFQFLNICTKRTLYLSQFHLAVVFFSCARSLSHSSSKSPLSFRSHSMWLYRMAKWPLPYFSFLSFFLSSILNKWKPTSVDLWDMREISSVKSFDIQVG